jgi:2'-5' RNA ligase
MRLFIAIDLSEEARREVGEFLKKQEKKYWPVKWEKIEKVHITLAFLGETSEENLKKVKEAVKMGCMGIFPFELSLRGVGCFPDFLRPKVVWIGLVGNLKSLARLQRQIENQLMWRENLGFEVERRAFIPHLTIGRVKRGKFRHIKEMGRQVRNTERLEFFSKIRVSQVAIYKSELLPEGSKYTKLEEVALVQDY